jgi:hypothetical protein
MDCGGEFFLYLGDLQCGFILQLTPQQTQTKMEEWNIGNVKAALEKGRLNNIVPEQADM